MGTGMGLSPATANGNEQSSRGCNLHASRRAGFMNEQQVGPPEQLPFANCNRKTAHIERNKVWYYGLNSTNIFDAF
jgi:hypothetical protein